MEEIWKDVIGLEGIYKISSIGRVKSFKYNKEKFLKLQKAGSKNKKYYKVTLHNKKINYEKYVHTLVAESFLNHKPNGYNIVVDHINDDSLDNRLENLQLISQRENAYRNQNSYTSKYKGVCWSKKSNKWTSHIWINPIKKYLGLFENEYDAHLAYQNAVKNLQQ